MSKDKLENIRHTFAHLLAAAVLELWPDTKRAIGPAIENGFYYDFEFNSPFSETDLPKIEKQMRKILPTWKNMVKNNVTPEEAKNLFKDNPYKHELIDEYADDGLTTYTSGNYTDLCRGGHANKPKEELNADAFKLTHIAGAYWRGDERNKMLTRIYGVAFETKEELDKHLEMLEEAKKRDHRKLGKQLDLFTFSDLVGAGLPLFTPKGTVIRTELQKALLDISKKYNVQQVMIPHIAKRALYETSGHAIKFGDELLPVQSRYGSEFIMKPVNCPHHTQIYASRLRSYRDLPVRFMESTIQYRDEKPGEIGGLTRTRGFMVDDGHIFCRVDQIKQEAIAIANIIQEFYAGLGMYGNHWVSLSVRDPNTPDAYVGEPQDWDKAEKMLKEVSDELGLDAKRVEGEAAIYGPKLDYMFKDALGKERQLSTIQLDFAMPKRFGLTYTSNNGEQETPVMIHRAILGSYERFMAILIEHFAGAFPLWLSPVQVGILPISDKHVEYANKIKNELREQDIRVEVDDSSETMGKKIRNGESNKINYLVIIGDKEIEANKIAVRKRGGEDLGQMELEAFTAQLKKEIDGKTI